MAEREKLTVKGDYSLVPPKGASLFLEYSPNSDASGQRRLRRELFERLKGAAKGGEKTPQELLVALVETGSYTAHSDASGLFVAAHEGGYIGKPERYLEWLRTAVKNDWFLSIGYSSLLSKAEEELTIPRARGGYVKDFDLVKDIVRLKTARGLRTYRLSEISWMQLFHESKFPTVVEFRVTPIYRFKASWEIIFHESYERAGFTFKPKELEKVTSTAELQEEPKVIHSSDRGFTTGEAEELVGSVVIFRQNGRKEVFTLAAVAYEEENNSTLELTASTGKILETNRFKDYLAKRPEPNS